MLQNLPESLFVKIIKFLPLVELTRMRRTCMRYNELIKTTRCLWRNTRIFTPDAFDSLEDEKIYCDSLISFAGSIPRDVIVEISWKISPSLSSYLLRLLWLCTESLVYLDVYSEELTDALVELICEHMPNGLVHLGITGSPYITEKLFSFILNKPCRLTSVDFSYNNLLGNDGFADFVRSIESDLKSVVLRDVCDVTDFSLEALVEMHGHCLERLHIDGEKISTQFFKEIVKCVKLKALIVDFASSLSDNIFPELAQLTSLEEIGLRKGRSLSSNGFRVLTSCGNLSKVQKLNLSECDLLSNENVRDIGTACPLLTHFHIAWCTLIDDSGLVEIIMNCHHMLDMDLSGLDKLEGTHFALVPFSMPYLQRMKLEMCGAIDERDMHWIVIQMKGQLEVIDFYHQVIVYDANNGGQLITGFESSRELLSISASENVTVSSVPSFNTPVATAPSSSESRRSVETANTEEESTEVSEEVVSGSQQTMSSVNSSGRSENSSDNPEGDEDSEEWETEEDTAEVEVNKLNINENLSSDSSVEFSSDCAGSNVDDVSICEHGNLFTPGVSFVGEDEEEDGRTRQCCRNVRV